MENLTDDYYEFIGVERNATSKEVKDACKKLLMKYHPDKCKDIWADGITKRIFEIREVLLDAEKRKEYDEILPKKKDRVKDEQRRESQARKAKENEEWARRNREEERERERSSQEEKIRKEKEEQQRLKKRNEEDDKRIMAEIYRYTNKEVPLSVSNASSILLLFVFGYLSKVFLFSDSILGFILGVILFLLTLAKFAVYRDYRRINKSVNFINSGKYDEAVKVIDEIKKTKYAQSLNNKALALKRLGQIDKALLIYDLAIKEKPKNADIWINKGFALEKLCRYDEAIICYKNAIEVKEKEAISRSRKK